MSSMPSTPAVYRTKGSGSGLDIVRMRTQAGVAYFDAGTEVLVRSRRHRRGVHPIVLDDPYWKSALSLADGDYLCVPVITEKSDTLVVDLSGYVQSGTDTLGRETFANRAVSSFDLTPDSAWLIGLYVAEGSSSPNVTFSLNSTEDAYIERIERVATDMGYSASRFYDPRSRSCRVSLGTTVLGRWLKETCGRFAQEKRIPDMILAHRDSEIRHAFLEGLMDGDGCRTTRSTGAPYWVVRTSSRPLMESLVVLLAQDRIGVSTEERMQRERQIRGVNLPQTPFYGTSWNPDGARPSMRAMNGRTISSTSHRWKADETGVWYPLTDSPAPVRLAS